MSRWPIIACMLASAAARADAPAPAPVAEAHAARTQTALVLPTRSLVYAVEWGSMNLGEAHITLAPTQEPGCYRYESVTKPIGLVRMFYGAPSDLSLLCVNGKRLVPRRFEHRMPNDEDESYTLDFDIRGGRVRDGRGGIREIPEDAWDALGLQQAVRLWVIRNLDQPDPGVGRFTLVEDDSIRPYEFGITARETVETPAGSFETIRVERLNDLNKISRYWIAPELDYLPVKLEQVRKKKNQRTRMLLKRK